MSKKKINVLILTADVGFGHRSAAKAIEDGLLIRDPDGCRIKIINPLYEEHAPALLRETETDYDRLVRQMPDVYKLQYEFSDAPVPNAIIGQALTVLLYTVIRDVFRKNRPDIVVCTHPYYPAPVGAVNALNRFHVPVVTVITDLTMVHRQWFNDSSDLIVAPTEDVHHQALKQGVPGTCIQVTGIPVSPELGAIPHSKKELRKKLGWLEDRYVLLAVGSKRVKNLDTVLSAINHSALPIQIVAVAGGDNELYAAFQRIEWHVPAKVYNFVDEMPSFLQAADIVMSKAGGLIVTETLACGLPMLLVDVTPGQEEGNAEYVIRHGAAERAEGPLQVLECVFHLLDNDGQLLRKRSMHAMLLGKPEAALDVADSILSLARREESKSEKLSGISLRRLSEVLARFGLVSEPEPQPKEPN